MSFKDYFAALTGNEPFYWQEDLYDNWFAKGNFPDSCNLPTGLGKTSVMAIWLIALAMKCPNMPRRLVYVVNRRTVVDQSTAEAVKMRELLLKPSSASRPEHVDVLGELRARLQTLAAVRDGGPLAISTLRGQFVDNREWSADPARPAIIAGTVDMIGSRLLFSGYGVGFKAKPLHAGFLGQDALLVHDEAHLEPAFQELLLTIQREQRHGRFPDQFPLRVMELSATSRTKGEVFTLTQEEKHADFASATASNELRTVWKRTHAAKRLSLVEQVGTKPGEQLATLAIEQFKSSTDAILIFARTIDDVSQIVAALDKAKLPTAQLIGPMRGLERDGLLVDPVFNRFLPESNRAKDIVLTPGLVFLVCTSAGEVGVNISADHLVCDLSTFESMAQRFGRVNRFGLRTDTQIHVVHPTRFDEKDKLSPAREKTLALLRQLNGDASPNALSEKLSADARADAFAPPPVILPASDILFDAWSMTSIRGPMPGRPKVEPYLHGIREWEPPETNVAWREEVGEIRGDLLVDYPPKDLLDDYPLRPHELLGDTTARIWKELEKLAARNPSEPVWIMDDVGEVEVIAAIGSLAKLQRKDAEARIARRTVLLPHDVGGLTMSGMLDGSYPAQPKAGETGTPIDNDVSDRIIDPNRGRPARLRVWDDDPAFEVKSAGMRLIRRIQQLPPEDEEDAETRSWLWLELPLVRENSKHAVKPVLWKIHTKDVVDRVREIVAELGIENSLKQSIILAAQFHDLGKRRELWQRSIGRPLALASEWFAKSGRGWKSNDFIQYRHEFGSLVDLETEPEFFALDEDCKELVRHLIAAHHGQARPHFTLEQSLDPTSTATVCDRIACDVPRRFAHLQRTFGRWGLAYYESILRAADWHASANPSEFYEEGVSS